VLGAAADDESEDQSAGGVETDPNESLPRNRVPSVSIWDLKRD